MSVLAYSELLKRIFNIDENQFRKPYQILSRYNPTKNRIEILKQLALHDKITIGQLLKKTNHNKGGGSYLTIKKYFENLAKEGLLIKYQKKKKILWSFSEEYLDVKRFILQ
ncbi:hypothetical protein K8R47_01665 [archaeon]|nr:hypothetical protein [archaeon]